MGVDSFILPKVRILIADDHPLLRRGLASALTADPHFELVAEVDNGAAALDVITQEQPHVAVLDLDMPQLGALEVARRIVERKLQTRVVVLTLHHGWDFFYAALDLGVQGYVLKENSTDDVMSAIRHVADGSSFVSPILQPALMQRAMRKDPKSVLAGLTSAELRVLRRVGSGLSSRHIAEELGIASRTVETHRNNICNKLCLEGTNALLRFAMDRRAEIERFQSTRGH